MNRHPNRAPLVWALMIGVLSTSGCVLAPYQCQTEHRDLEASASLRVTASDATAPGSFRFFFLQSRGREESVSLSFGFTVGMNLQDSVAFARIREGRNEGEGRVLLDVPAHPGLDGGPERLLSGLAPMFVPGPVGGAALVDALASGPAHVEVGFLSSRVPPVSAPLRVSGPSAWMESCT